MLCFNISEVCRHKHFQLLFRGLDGSFLHISLSVNSVPNCRAGEKNYTNLSKYMSITIAWSDTYVYHQLPNSCLPPATDNEARPTACWSPSSSSSRPWQHGIVWAVALVPTWGGWGGDNTHLESIAGALLQIQLILTPHRWDVPGCCRDRLHRSLSPLCGSSPYSLLLLGIHLLSCCLCSHL